MRRRARHHRRRIRYWLTPWWLRGLGDDIDSLGRARLGMSPSLAPTATHREPTLVSGLASIDEWGSGGQP